MTNEAKILAGLFLLGIGIVAIPLFINWLIQPPKSLLKSDYETLRERNER